jgi:hypothetical protein
LRTVWLAPRTAKRRRPVAARCRFRAGWHLRRRRGRGAVVGGARKGTGARPAKGYALPVGIA